MVKSLKGELVRCFLQHTSMAYLENHPQDKLLSVTKDVIENIEIVLDFIPTTL